MQLKQNVIFEKQDYTVKALVTAEYENCIFRNCNFASASLAGIVFTDCSFTDCNFSMTNVKGTSFKTVEFKNCKLTGLNFSSCNPFLLSMNFAECLLNLTSFYNLRMKNSRFLKCNLQEADMVQADFSGVSFLECDFRGAVFEKSILEKVDMSSAINFIIDPETNRIKKAKFSLLGLSGLLCKYRIIID